MDGTCGTYGERRRAYRFWWGGLRKRENFEDLGIEWKIFQNGYSRFRMGGDLDLTGLG